MNKENRNIIGMFLEAVVFIGCCVFIFVYLCLMIELFYLLTPTSIIYYALRPLRKIGVKIPVQLKYATWEFLELPIMLLEKIMN